VQLSGAECRIVAMRTLKNKNKKKNLKNKDEKYQRTKKEIEIQEKCKVEVE
jgi:hypothetical protein